MQQNCCTIIHLKYNRYPHIGMCSFLRSQTDSALLRKAGSEGEINFTLNDFNKFFIINELNKLSGAKFEY